MAMASVVKVVLGLIAFGIFWVLAVFPSVPFLPIGRTAGSLLGAMLMVVFQVETPEEAYAAIDLSILGLLFGTMVVSIYLERADMFRYLGNLVAWKSLGAKDLVCRICLISAISSALFTNDTSCVILTEFVLKVARQHNLPPHPFLLALASSSNIGSSATPIGNPQNLVIAINSKISFGAFVTGILPSMLVGVVVNIIYLMCMYWKLLSSTQKDEEDATAEVVSDEDVQSHRFSSATLEPLSNPNSQEGSSALETTTMNGSASAVSHPETLRSRVTSTEHEISNVPSSSADSSKEIDGSLRREETVSSKRESSVERVRDISSIEISEFDEDSNSQWKRRLSKLCIYIVTVGMLVALLAGLNMSWTAITAAIVLVVLDFEDARPCLDKVSYSLLIFFCGMFITVDGFNNTGVPSYIWDKLEPYAHVNHAAGTALLAVIILLLSNLVSNVPAVLLLGSRVAASAAAISVTEEKKAWLILAWVSTVAGNLSLLGSATNLIVCEQARSARHFGYNLSFWTHLEFGFPSTLLVTAVGLTLIRR